MPIFEYECAKCQKIFEVVSSGNSTERIKCPRCRSRKVTKLFSGFYVIAGKASGRGRDTGGAKASSSCRSCASKSCSTCR